MTKRAVSLIFCALLIAVLTTTQVFAQNRTAPPDPSAPIEATAEATTEATAEVTAQPTPENVAIDQDSVSDVVLSETICTRDGMNTFSYPSTLELNDDDSGPYTLYTDPSMSSLASGFESLAFAPGQVMITLYITDRSDEAAPRPIDTLNHDLESGVPGLDIEPIRETTVNGNPAAYMRFVGTNGMVEGEGYYFFTPNELAEVAVFHAPGERAEWLDTFRAIMTSITDGCSVVEAVTEEPIVVATTEATEAATVEAIDLTQTFCANFARFDYPDGWTMVQTEDDATYFLAANARTASLIPTIQNASSPNDIQLQPGDGLLAVIVESSTTYTAEETLALEARNPAQGAEYGEIETAIINGNQVATVRVNYSGIAAVLKVVGFVNGMQLRFVLLTTSDDIEAYAAALDAMSNTAERRVECGRPLATVTPAATFPPTSIPAESTQVPTTTSEGSVLRQWASGASATSEYSSDYWSARQVIGAPDTIECGDYGTAWASETASGKDTLTVTFDQPVDAQQVNIYETYNPGAISEISLIPADGGSVYTIQVGPDTTACPGVFSIDVSNADVGAINSVAITLDQRLTGTWNEIDAVELVGVPNESALPGPTPTATATVPPTTTPTPTPSARLIEYGQTIEDNLIVGQQQIYTFQGQVADAITIRMDGEFDTVLELYDSAGNLVASNDDFNGLNSQIDTVLTSADTYTIVARSFGNAHEGAFTLSLTLNSSGTTSGDVKGGDTSTGDSTGGAIEYGQTINGVLAANQPLDYSFSGTSGDLVVITLNSDDFDPYLVLNNSDGQEITHNDDANGLDSQITVTLPVTGTYHIIARGYSSSSSGAFSLLLQGGSAEEMGVGSIEYGQTITDHLAVDQERSYTFEGQVNDAITIRMDGGFDTVLELYDSAGNLVASNDDFNGLNSQIDTVLTSTDEYRIVARSFLNSHDGTFTLSLMLSDSSGNDVKGGDTSGGTSGGTANALTYGQTVEGTLLTNQQVEYTFSATANDVVIIMATSNDFNPSLTLNDSDGREIMQSDNTFLTSAQIATTLASSGTYHIVVRGLFSIESGVFTLSLQGGTADEMDLGGGPIEYGQTIDGTLTAGLTQDFSFSGQQGDSVTISLNSDDFDPYLVLNDANGEEIVHNDDYNDLNSQISIALPSSGTYHIIVRDFWGDDSGAFTLQLTQGATGK